MTPPPTEEKLHFNTSCDTEAHMFSVCVCVCVCMWVGDTNQRKDLIHVITNNQILLFQKSHGVKGVTLRRESGMKATPRRFGAVAFRVTNLCRRVDHCQIVTVEHGAAE